MENGETDHQFSDEEGYVDTIKDDELLQDILEKRPTADDAAESIIIVDGIPIVGQERIPKLTGFLEKILARVGKIENICIPEDDGQTKGFMFVEYENKTAADSALVLDGYNMDKTHQFKVNKYSDLAKFENIPEKWETPEPRPYKDHGNLKSWMLTPGCRDQFVVMYESGDRVAVFQHRTKDEPGVLVEKERWTETTVRWSPQGSYMATFHGQGIALWGGEHFEQITKFAHKDVMYIDFSPTERYLVTYSLPKSRYMSSPEAIKVWDVITGELLRSFPGGEDTVTQWPYIKWSPKDVYFGVKHGASVYVYQMPKEVGEKISLLDDKSLKLEGIKDFMWSPTDQVFAYWLAERDQIPARLGIMKIPQKEDIRSKNLFNVADARIYWQKEGEFLCVKVDRYNKSRMDKDNIVQYLGITHNLEIFHMRGKDLPNDTIEHKEPIKAFAWEPTASKFVIVHGEIRLSVSIYNAKNGIQLLKTFEVKSQINSVFWAPTGTYCVITGLKMNQASGPLLFIDTNELAILHTQEHTGLTDVEWDPTGRYVTTSVSSHGGKGDYGYILWNFQGQLKMRRPMDRFVFLSWRPRPHSMLTDVHKKEIRKGMKRFAEEFEESDKQTFTKISKDILEKRQELKAKFEAWRAEKDRQYATMQQQRIELRDGHDCDHEDAVEMDEETVEFLVKETEEVVGTVDPESTTTNQSSKTNTSKTAGE